MQGFLDPEQVLSHLELKQELIAAEFGSGSGNFSLALAKRVPEGKVYALDIREEPLSALKSRAKQEGLGNIETIRCDLEQAGGSTLANDYLDLVLIPNTLFQVEDREAVLKEATRVLKDGGKLLIIDWKKESVLGPKPVKLRITDQEIKKIASKLGLEVEKDFSAGNFHWGSILVFKKS